VGTLKDLNNKHYGVSTWAMEAMLANSDTTGCTEDWSTEFASPFLNCPKQGPWENSSFHNHLPNGWSQTWYDNARSTKIKVAMAKALGLGGVGVFTGEGAGDGKSADGLWAALGSFAEAKTGHGSDSSSKATAKTDDDTVIQIGSSTQLFADDLIIASMTSVTRTMHSPSMSDVAIQADQPW
jgi:hypothetical protein